MAKKVLLLGQKMTLDELAAEIRGAAEHDENILSEFAYKLGECGDWSYEILVLKKIIKDYVKDHKEEEPLICSAMKHLELILNIND